MSEETIGFCLHCGGESRVIQSKKGKESLYAIECSICSIKTAEYSTKEEALAVWDSKWLRDE